MALFIVQAQVSRTVDGPNKSEWDRQAQAPTFYVDAFSTSEAEAKALKVLNATDNERVSVSMFVAPST